MSLTAAQSTVNKKAFLGLKFILKNITKIINKFGLMPKSFRK
jgi:hypothetical protein